MLASHYGRCGNRHHTHGGSLQDLVDCVNNEHIIDTLNGNSRRINQENSRKGKYTSTSVSSRQREGGSLPSNINGRNSFVLFSNNVNTKPQSRPTGTAYLNENAFSK